MTVHDAKRRAGERARARRRVVVVIGSGEVADPACGEIGRLIATLGFDLLTGGGGGVMEAVSRGFYETAPRKGIVVGVIPAEVTPIERLEQRLAGPIAYDLRPGYPNPWVELAIYTHLPDSGPDGTLRSSRNHINVLSADAIVALPGGEGTLAETWLAGQYGVPAIAFGTYTDAVPLGMRHARTLEELREFLTRAAAT